MTITQVSYLYSQALPVIQNPKFCSGYYYSLLLQCICVILLGWSQRLAVACGTLLVYRFTCKYWVNETKAAKVFSLEG